MQLATGGTELVELPGSIFRAPSRRGVHKANPASPPGTVEQVQRAANAADDAREARSPRRPGCVQGAMMNADTLAQDPC